MATISPNKYEPAPRVAHTPVLVGGNLFLWGGWVNNMPKVHDSLEKRRFLSSVDVFQSDSGDWIRQETSGIPPLGVSGYCCTAVDDSLYYFGGWCGHDKCYHNSVHKLSTSSLQWMMLSPSKSESMAPMKKRDSGMVAFRDGDEDILCVVAGYGRSSTHRQPGAHYVSTEDGDDVWCNEQHMFSLSNREWSSPRVTGQPPPPSDDFTLTLVDERRAALFGGDTGSLKTNSNDLLIVDLTKHTVHWTNISKPVHRSMKWPTGRCGHAATCVSEPLLVIVGGKSDRQSIISDCWIYDFITMKWMTISLPDIMTKRMYHSLSAIQLSPHNVLLVAFGGRRSFSGDDISHTVLTELRFVRLHNVVQEEKEKANEIQLQLIGQIQLLVVQQPRQQLSETEERVPHWVVRREEVELTEEVLGRGGWGEVRVAKFRGLRVAAKFMHDKILSDYNRRQFVREMTIAAELRHPHLLLFIGATREGQAIILTELMPTSLRKELEMKSEMPRVHITSISQDVGHALCYLHQCQPHPIIHRDISSANILLEPLPNGCWRAKVSDYGSANFMNLFSTTIGPGNPTYAAPEASSPHQHSPKMDVYSYGILLVEMCLRELPEPQPERRQEQIQRIQWISMVSLIRRCTSMTADDRPTMMDIMELLDRLLFVHV